MLDRRYPASSLLRASPPPRAAEPAPRGVLVVVHVPHRRGFPFCLSIPLSCMPSSLPRWTPWTSVARLLHRRRPSPLLRRVGFHITLFEACSTFTRVTACMLADSPKGSLSLKCFSPIRYLLEPPQVLPAGATSCRAGITPAEDTRLCTAHCHPGSTLVHCRRLADMSTSVTNEDLMSVSVV